MEAVKLASDDLCANMTTALNLINELTELSKLKETHLIAGDIEELRSLTEKEEELIAALGINETSRKLCAETLSKSVGLFGEDVSLGDIVEKIDVEATRALILNLRDTLISSMKTLFVRNEKLGELLQLQIGYTDYMLNFLYIPKSKNNAYDLQGNRKNENNNLSLLDFHV